MWRNAGRAEVRGNIKLGEAEDLGLSLIVFKMKILQ